MQTHFFKLINGDVVFGEIEASNSEDGGQTILVKRPYTAVNGAVMPYMMQTMTEPPKAINILPMNVLWSCPLDEFPTASSIYQEETSSIILP